MTLITQSTDHGGTERRDGGFTVFTSPVQWNRPTLSNCQSPKIRNWLLISVLPGYGV